MSEYYIGLMSGTSADGIDAALVDFNGKHPKLIDSHYQPFDTALRNEILELCVPGENEINRLGILDNKLGKAFAAAANFLINKNNSISIRAIGSHGQTIRHHPTQSFTLQIGDPNVIAAETGITTVADFRRKDLAFGGQGAPLVPIFHQHVFGIENQNRIILNIGGIANVTILNANGTMSGFDTGPGNTLLDAWIEKHHKKTFDKNGEWAKSGNVNHSLLKNLLEDSYFKLQAPKSTGREYFNLNWLQKHLPEQYQPEDIQTTLVELTAISIVETLTFSEGEILICGGGAHNDFLITRIKHHARNFKVLLTNECGADPDWIEAMAFAWLAKLTIEGKTGNNITVTGAKKAAILGGIYPI